MVKTKIIHICEKCGEEYDSKAEAKECEKDCSAIIPKFPINTKVKEILVGRIGIVVSAHIINMRHMGGTGKTVGYEIMIDGANRTFGFIEEYLIGA